MALTIRLCGFDTSLTRDDGPVYTFILLLSEPPLVRGHGSAAEVLHMNESARSEKW